MGDFREALEAVLARPVTDAELSRAHRLGHPAGCLLRRAHGPVLRSEYPDGTVALVAVRIIARVAEGGGVLEVTDADLRSPDEPGLRHDAAPPLRDEWLTPRRGGIHPVELGGVTLGASADPASAWGRYFPTPHRKVGGFPFATWVGPPAPEFHRPAD